MRPAINERIGHGAVGGLLAGLTVALWFLVVDSLAGRPFHTPAVLAGALARQDIMAPTFRIVAAYTVVHFAVFALLGVAMAAAIGALRLPPRLLLGVPFGLVAQALVFGASNVGAIQPNLGLVAAYTAVHVAAFAVTGALFVAVAEQIERAPAFVLLAGMAAIVLEAVAVAALALGAQWVLGTLGTW